MVNYENDAKRKLLIIGNGFDRAHFLPTGYEHFKKYMSDLIRGDEGHDKQGECIYIKEVPESTIPKILTMDGTLADYEQERKIVYWLIDDVARRKHNIKWGKFENYLGQLKFNKVIREWKEDEFAVQCLRSAIDDISGFFFNWINTIDISAAQKREPYLSLINGKRDIALSFNYTETLEDVYEMDASNICYIHGQRETDVALRRKKNMSSFGKNNSHLVVGFGSKYVKSRNDVIKKSLLMGLYKDTRSIILQHNDFFNRVANSKINEIYSLGFSFSDADMSYIEKICEMIKQCNCESKIVWFISPYGNILQRVRDEIYFRKRIRKAGFRGKICKLKLDTER